MIFADAMAIGRMVHIHSNLMRLDIRNRSDIVHIHATAKQT